MLWSATVHRQFKWCELCDGTYEKWERCDSNSCLVLVYSNAFSRDQYKKASKTKVVDHYLKTWLRGWYFGIIPWQHEMYAVRIEGAKAFYGPFANLVVSFLAFWNFICHPRKNISNLSISSCSLEKQIYCYRYLLPAVFLKAPYTVILYELYVSQHNKLFL